MDERGRTWPGPEVFASTKQRATSLSLGCGWVADAERMVRKWSGFLTQNISANEEWDLMEACAEKAALATKNQNTIKVRTKVPVAGPVKPSRRTVSVRKGRTQAAKG